MDATAPPDTWKRSLWQALALLAFLAGGYYVPLLSLAAACLLPLIVCPAFVKGHVWFALALPLAPMAAFIASGGDLYIGLMLPLFAYLCLLTISFCHRRRVSFTLTILLCIGAMIAASLTLALRLGNLLGTPLSLGLADYITGQVDHSLLSGSILYRLTASGFLAVPEAYRNVAGIQFGNYILLNPLLRHELLNMLHLRLQEGFTQWLPTLLMQGSITIGLFTAFFTERVYATRLGGRAAKPLFRTLHLPRREQRFMLVLCILMVLTAFSNHALGALLSTLFYTAFMTIYQLLGAAVMIFLLARRRPERLTLYGIAAALLFIIFPLVLFVLGMADQFIHLRTASLKHQEEE